MATTKKTASRGRTTKKATRAARNTIGRELINAAKEALAFERGEGGGARVTLVPVSARGASIEPAPDYSKQEIADIRATLGLSQALFAQAFNVSSEAVKSWEQGKTPPGGAAKRLLEIAKKNPQIFLKALQPIAK